MDQENQVLFNLIEPEVVALGYETVGIEFRQNGRHALLRVYIDKAEGVTIGDCVLVNEQLASLLDAEDTIRGSYDLEVSSPGLDRPIFTIDQFRSFVGEMVRIVLSEKQDGSRRYKGTLVSVDDDKIVINCNNKMIELSHDLVERAHLVPQV